MRFASIILIFMMAFKAEAFWPFSSNESVQLSEFTYSQCQVFSKQSNKNEGYPKCTSHNSKSDLQSLDENVSKVELKLYEQEVLREVKDFVETRAQEGLRSLDQQIECLSLSLDGRALPDNCTNILKRLRLTIGQGLPLIRQTMAFMRPGPDTTRWRGLPRAQGANQFKEDIKHLYSPIDIPPISDYERKGLSDLFQQRVQSIKKPGLRSEKIILVSLKRSTV